MMSGMQKRTLLSVPVDGRAFASLTHPGKLPPPGRGASTLGCVGRWLLRSCSALLPRSEGVSTGGIDREDQVWVPRVLS